MKKFVGRKKELEVLKEKYCSQNPEFILLYGRRRLGKSALLKESLKNTKGLYFLSTQEPIQRNVASFSKHFSFQLDSKIALREDKTFLEYFENIYEIIPENFVFVFDEFPYLSENDNSLLSQFQKIYDEYLKPKNCKLVLCGSSLSIMSDIQNYKSPLYGRRTQSIKLKPFSYFETNDLLENKFSKEDVLKFHLLFGGVPYYLEQISLSLDFKNNIDNLFFRDSSLFFDEPTFLLKEEFREIKSYLIILDAISQGKNRFTQISQYCLIEKSSLSKYLKNLELIDLIVLEKSFFDKQNSKKTLYSITDNYLYFYFKVIKKNLNTIDNVEIQKDIITNQIPNALGYLFEKECKKILKSKYQQIGTYFNKDIEIDIIGKNNSQIDCIECNFSKKYSKEKELKLLKDKINYLPQDFSYNLYFIDISEESLNYLLKSSSQ